MEKAWHGTSCWLAGGGDGSPSSAMRTGVAAALPGAGLTPRLAAAPALERMHGDAPDVTPGVRLGVSPGTLPGVSIKPLLCSSLAVGAATRSACRTLQIACSLLADILHAWLPEQSNPDPNLMLSSLSMRCISG